MGVIQRFGDLGHTIIGRAIPDKTIEARNPSLINLPIPLPSIPVLTPLLSPLVGGSNSNDGDSGTTTTTTSAAAVQTSPSTTNSGSNSGSDNSGTSSSEGDSGSSSSSTGSTSSSGGDSGSSSSSGTGSSSSTSSSTGDTSSSGSTSSSGTTSVDPASGTGDSATTAGGTSEGNTGGATSSSGSTSSSGTTSVDTTSGTGGGTTTSGGTSGGITGGATSSASNAGTSSPNEVTTVDSSMVSDPPVDGASDTGASSSGGTPPDGVANTIKTPSSAGTSTSGSDVTGTYSISGAVSPSSTQGATVGSTGSGNNGESGSDTHHGTNHRLSGATIAGTIVVLIAVLLAGSLFIVRRRSRRRRDQHANMWFSSFSTPSETYGDQDEGETGTSGTRYAFISFAITVDRFNRPRRSSDVIQALPPMAEVGRPNGCTPMFTRRNSQFTSPDGQINNRDSTLSMGSSKSGRSRTSQHLSHSRRASVSEQIDNSFSSMSIGSIHSYGSENWQPRFLHHDISNPDLDMSLHVRSFSPLDLFAFCNPPDQANDRNSISECSRPSTSPTLAMKIPTSDSVLASGNIPPTSALPTPTLSPINNVADPFSDSNPFSNPDICSSRY